VRRSQNAVHRKFVEWDKGEVGEYVICGPSGAGLPGRWL
jgi:hypothetical protein